MRTEMVRYSQGRPSALFDDASAERHAHLIRRLLKTMRGLDEAIAALMDNEGAHLNERWGYMSRAGHEAKSDLQRQVEKSADIYMSRVSNLLQYTPYMYFRGSFQSLAHDKTPSDATLPAEDMPLPEADRGRDAARGAPENGAVDGTRWGASGAAAPASEADARLHQRGRGHGR
mmetsp:Transcript_20746/g.69586  ORF Transcript_20746/g.69586 Transcript_20746/m.69586 type:complete len:174 (-) Transcript_20746:450-971(-)